MSSTATGKPLRYANVWGDTRNNIQFEIDWPEHEEKKRSYIDAHKKFEPVDTSNVPPKIAVLVAGGSKLLNDIPDIFKTVGAVLVVSGRFKNLLQDFDIGSTQFYPVKLYGYRKTEPQPEDLYFLHILEKRTCFVPEKSTHVRKTGAGRWLNHNESEIATSNDFSADLDLWVDPLLHDLIFFSDRLYERIREEEIRAKKWNWGTSIPV